MQVQVSFGLAQNAHHIVTFVNILWFDFFI
jgi:hypothetical protein